MKKTDQGILRFSKCQIILLLLVPFCMACNPQADEGASGKEVQDADPVEGVWELSSNYWVLMDDTIYADPTGGLLHKIYFDGYVMWTSDPAPDSSEWHAFGTYKLSNNTLVEKLSSMSLPMKVANDSNDEFVIEVEYAEKFLKQEMEVPFRDTIYRYHEVWKKLN